MKLYTPWAGPGRIKAIVGHYGSGKTEIALNMVLGARSAGLPATIVDMDIVNPFFRSAEQQDLLEGAGVRLIAPPYARTGVDLPVLGAEILSIFTGGDVFTLLDVGGDDTGAAALGRFHPQLTAYRAEVLLVVNAYRPFSRTPDQVLELMERIENRSRMQVTGLINNGNLGELTGQQEVQKGQELVEEVSRRSGRPLVCACGTPEALGGLSREVPVFPIRRLLMPEWLMNK